MAVSRSTSVAVGGDPGPDDLWSPAAFVRPDWSAAHVVRSSYSTAIDVAQNGREQRRALQDRPRLGVSLPVAGLGLSGQQTAWTVQARMAYARSLVAVYPDSVVADGRSGFGRGGGLWTGQQSVAFEAGSFLRNRRFFQGGWVLVARRDWSEAALRYMATVDRGASTPGFTLDSSVSFVASGSGVADAGVVVVPCVEARMVPQSSRDLITRQDSKFSLDAVETYGATALQGIVPVGDLSALEALGIASHDGAPIFPAESIDFGQGVSVGFDLASSVTSVGLDVVGTRYGPRPRQTCSAVWRALSRDSWVRLAGLWDYCGGAALPFWFVSPANDLRFVSFDSGSKILTVEAAGDESDWLWRPAVGMVRRSDGLVEVRRVVDFNRSGSVDEVEVETAFSFGDDPADVRRCAGAYLARFASDEVEQRWLTYEVCDTRVSVLEVTMDEADTSTVAVPNVVEISDALGEVSAVHDPGDCVDPMAFLLTSCIDGSTITVRSGLDDYVGRTVDIDEFPTECFTVEMSTAETTDYDTVTVARDYGDCSGIYCGGCLPGTLSINSSNPVYSPPTATAAASCWTSVAMSSGLGTVGGATCTPGNFSASIRRHTSGSPGTNATPIYVARCRTPKVDKNDVVRIRITGTVALVDPGCAATGEGFRFSARVCWKSATGNYGASGYPSTCLTMRSRDSSDGAAQSGTADFELVFDYNVGSGDYEYNAGASTNQNVAGISFLASTDAISRSNLTLGSVGAAFYAECGNSCQTGAGNETVASITNLKIHYDEAVAP